MPISSRSRAFVPFLGALAALSPLSIDMSLPALREITSALQTTPSLVGLTLSLFMVGFCSTPVLYGPLSDRYGRKPILVVGLLLFALGGAGSALAPGIDVLLAARLLQGAGAGAGIGMALAIVRDVFEGAEARRRLAYVTIVMSVAPMIAPTIGAGVLEIADWRAIYGVLAIAGAALLLLVFLGYAETARFQGGRGPLIAGILRGYRRLFGHRASFGFTLVYGLCFGVQFSYVSGSPLVMMGSFGVSARTYGLLFACTALAIMAGAYTNGRLNAHKVPPIRALLGGFALMTASGTALVALTALGLASVARLMPFLALSSYAYGLLMPNISHGAMDPVPEVAGIAGSMLTSFQMATGALVSALVAMLFAGAGLYAMTGMMLLFAVLAVATYLTVIRPWR